MSNKTNEINSPAYMAGQRVRLPDTLTQRFNVLPFAVIKHNLGNQKLTVEAIDSTSREQKQFDVHTVGLRYYG